MHLNRLKILLVVFFTSVLLISCKKAPVLLDNTIPDLAEIQARGKIKVITENNSISYFVYKAEPMGFQYELIKLFANEINVKLEIIVTDNIDSAFSSLKNNRCDLIAMGLNITPERMNFFNFSVPYTKTSQVLVQKLPTDWKILSKKHLDSLLIRSPLQLAGKKVHIQPFTSFKENLDKISYLSGNKVMVVDSIDLQTEELISKVSDGSIQYAVCDENEAKAIQHYYPNIDISTKITLPEDLGWATSKGADTLIRTLNNWLSEFVTTKKYKQLYKKYYHNPGYVRIMNSSFFSEKGNKISEFDESIKKYSKQIGWDWRLIAALIFEESQFITDTTNEHSGAFGIMQLMPSTAQIFNVDVTSSVDANIWAGIMLLKKIEKQFMDITDTNERLKFVIAAYNSGIAHIFDARRLTKKFGKNMYLWDNNVEFYLRKKSNRKFYTDPVVYYGYYRGDDTYWFVRDIMERYHHYKNVIRHN